MKVILLLTGLGILALLAELFKFKKVLYPLMLIGLLAGIATAASYWWTTDGQYEPYLNGMVGAVKTPDGNIISNHAIPPADLEQNGGFVFRMIEFGPSSMLISIILLSTTFLWLLMSKDFFKEESSNSDHYALLIFSLVGAVVLSCYANMTMLFLGIEILSIPLYVLAGSRKTDLASNESSFKYFLMGSFASGFLLFGIALIYGATGTFDLKAIGSYISSANDVPAFFYAGILLLLVGLLFKVSAAPFHFWAPDVYQGAPTQITAFMSTVVKTAAIVAVMRLFLSPALGGAAQYWVPVVGFCAGLTMIVGNVTAVVQDNVKRLLAFSSISHAGFLLLAVTAFSGFSPKAIIFYTAAYSVASITAFTVLLNIMQQTGTDAVDSFNGLGKKNPLLAVAMTIALLSLAGIPPTAGFFGKYYIFTAALERGHTWLVVIGILSSLVGVYYYFRIIIAMFFKTSPTDNAITANTQHQLLLFVTAVIILVLGLLPDLLLQVGTAAASNVVAVTP